MNDSTSTSLTRSKSVQKAETETQLGPEMRTLVQNKQKHRGLVFGSRSEHLGFYSRKHNTQVSSRHCRFMIWFRCGTKVLHVLRLMPSESGRGEPGPASALSFKYNLGRRRLSPALFLHHWDYMWTVTSTLSLGRRYSSRATRSHWHTVLRARRVGGVTPTARVTGGAERAASLWALAPRTAPPRAVCTAAASTWLRRDNASTEPRSHYTHQIHKCGARCNSLTPTLHCQLFIIRMYLSNSASDRLAISQHN